MQDQTTNRSWGNLSFTKGRSGRGRQKRRLVLPMQHAAIYNLPALFTASASRRNQALPFTRQNSDRSPSVLGRTLWDGGSQAFAVSWLVRQRRTDGSGAASCCEASVLRNLHVAYAISGNPRCIG